MQIPEEVQDPQLVPQGDVEASIIAPQNRGARRSEVINITEENKDRVSLDHMGMLRNPDGSFSMTPQFVTWSDNHEIQLERLRKIHPRKPTDLGENHPDTSNLAAGWTYSGEWALAPTLRKRGDPDYNNRREVRVEKYIDQEGNIKKAVCYGIAAENLKVWYRMEDMLEVFPQWVLPDPNPFYNGRKFNKNLKRPTQTVNDQGDQRNKSSSRRGRRRRSRDGSSSSRSENNNRGRGNYGRRGRGTSYGEK